MDIERPHRTSSTPTTTSELFICFTSRLSKSSSMRLSSKSILSPGRAADKQNHSLSLSTSLSRRLRHNGSLRGAQSPAMFPSSKKNKGSSGFAENPEPSSPKVTCIGQVRVKTKKQGEKMKMRACRSKRLSGGGGSGGEASFRRIEHSNSHEVLQNQNQQAQECGLNHRNQRWVHLPITICEALRTFGSEFSCLFPCKSSCFSSGSFCGGEKTGENRGGEHHSDGGTNSCAVFRWLVSLQEGEGGEGKRRDIELVVGGEEEEAERGVVMERECSRRRSIFDDMEFDDLFSNVKNGGGERSEIFGGNVVAGDDEVEEGGRRVSLCIPPKNALLLMRCRSDPMKMASLSRKLWEVEVPITQDDDDDDDDDDEDEVEVEDVTEAVKVVENEVGLEEKIEEIRDAKAEENRDVETEETRDVKTEEICEVMGGERGEEIGEEKNVEIGEELEGINEGSEEVDQFLEKISRGFAEEEHRKTEELQIIENRGNAKEEECEVFEETQVMEDEIYAIGCSIEMINVQEEVQDDEIDAIRCSVEMITVQEKVRDDETEQDLVNRTEDNQELNIEEEEIEKTVEFSESDDLSIVHEAEEKTSCESSEISGTSSSPLNSSEESTAESKERDEEKKDTVEEVVQEVERKSMEEKPKPGLPDCLMLMMCEPKVSMEVSKETWVCSTDFVRWLPERHPKKVVNKTDGLDESTTKKSKPAAVAAIPPHLVQRFEQAAQPPIQPGRSSISFPAGGGTAANLIEQKLVKAGGYEPFVLTRCKSAPMRSAGKLAPPEMACSMWGREKGRKLEPHRPATFGVGAAEVGF